MHDQRPSCNATEEAGRMRLHRSMEIRRGRLGNLELDEGWAARTAEDVAIEA